MGLKHTELTSLLTLLELLCHNASNSKDIKANYADRIVVSKLAGEVFLHPDYLGRIFRDATGMSVSTMIQKIRIENACRFLSEAELNVADVGRRCGFPDTRFFYTVFKKRMDVSPGEYRKRMGRE